MSVHRSTRSRVSKNHPLDNFNPADALESLHTEVVQLEAFAHLAAEVITRLSPPQSREQRRDYRRLYALIAKVADDAIAAVNHGDALISALSADMAARRAQRPHPPRRRRSRAGDDRRTDSGSLARVGLIRAQLGEHDALVSRNTG